MERLRGLKTPEMLKFVTVFFLMPWLFAIAEIRFLVLFGDLHLPEWKIKNFSGLYFW